MPTPEADGETGERRECDDERRSVADRGESHGLDDGEPVDELSVGDIVETIDVESSFEVVDQLAGALVKAGVPLGVRHSPVRLVGRPLVHSVMVSSAASGRQVIPAYAQYGPAGAAAPRGTSR